MAQNLDLEIRVIKKFVDKSKQDRYIQFISSLKSRAKFVNDLAHFNYFNWELFHEIKNNEEHAIFSTLQNNKVKDDTCYIISEDIEIDTKRLDTVEAIQETIGFGNGTILVFGDAEIIFYEGEPMKSRYISRLVRSDE